MSAAPRRLVALLGLTLLLAACGANGEGAPSGGAGCPVGSAASSCGEASTSTSTSACNSTTQTAGDSFTAYVNLSTKLPDGLQYGDFSIGCGPVVKTGDTVKVQYTGWLADNGNQFDSSRQSGRQAFPVTLGQGQVIKGWDEGIPGMHYGGKRRLVIPAALGYGVSGHPPVIPANATLVFDVEVLPQGS